MASNILYAADRNPSVSATLYDGSGAVFNLTGYTVQFALRRDYATSNLVKAAATVVSAAGGTVRYDWGSNDLTSAVPGTYWGQWIATDGSSRAEHIDAGSFEIREAA